MSSIDSITRKGLEGINQGLQRASKAARQIASEGPEVDSIVELKQAEQEVKASRKVVEAGDRMSRELLNILDETA